MHTLNIIWSKLTIDNLLKGLTGVFQVFTMLFAALFLWTAMSFGFARNAFLDNQTADLMWSSIGVAGWILTFSATMIVLWLGHNKINWSAVGKIFFLTACMTAGVALCAIVGYAGTVLFTGIVTAAIVAIMTTGACAIMWYGFRKCADFWLTAE